MIKIPKRKCDVSNCNNLINIKNKYCDEHKEFNYDKQRYKNDKEVRRTYNNVAWSHVRLSCLMRDDYLCLYCLEHNVYTRATCVDHFMPIRDAFDDRYDMNNLVSACTACNTAKYYDEVKLRTDKITLEMYKKKWKYTINE